MNEQHDAQLTLDVGLKLEPPAGSTFRLQGELSSLEQLVLAGRRM